MEPTIYKPSIYKGAGIYKTGAEGGGGVPELPPEYKKLMYVYINGQNNERLNLGPFDCRDKINLQYEICLTDTFTSGSKSWEYIWSGNESGRYYVDFNNNRSYFKIGWGDYGDYIDTSYEQINRNKFVNISIYIDNTNKLIVNYNGTQYNKSNILPKERNLGVLSYRYNEDFINTKLFGVTIYENDTDKVKNQYIPVLRVADSVPGIYDIINGRFVRAQVNLGAGPIID